MAARERYVEAAGNLGLALLTGGDDEAAEAVLRECLGWRADHVDAAINLGNLLRRRGRFDEALPWLELAARSRPDDAINHANLALLLTDLGRHGEAVEAAQRALALDERNARWWCIAGIAQRLQHDVEGATTSLRRAADLDPHDDTAKLELALASLDGGDVDASRSLLAALRPVAGANTHPLVACAVAAGHRVALLQRAAGWTRSRAFRRQRLVRRRCS